MKLIIQFEGLYICFQLKYWNYKLHTNFNNCLNFWKSTEVNAYSKFLTKNSSWTKRIQNSIKNSFLGTPRFHRRKQSTPGSNQSLIDGCSDESGAYMSNSTSTDSEKKSWFKDVWNSVNQDTNYSIIIDEQHPQKVKNQLIQVHIANFGHFKSP